MIAADPLFGAIDIPSWLEKILLTPEVQRLREVRLINTTTPYLAALSDTRRYTHTVGVLALALRVHSRLSMDFSREERDALLIAAVLHDVGTPPFAHLFEYLLTATIGWTHEGMLKHIVAGDYRPEGRYHQVYYGNQLALSRVLRGWERETQLALEYVEGRGGLGTLIAGRLDLDNIDNVYRMCSLLGFRPDVAEALALADGLGVGEGRPVVSRTTLSQIDAWRSWRRRAYEVLAFDESSLQGQAMLTDALSIALEQELLSAEQWAMTDEELLSFLFKKGRQYPPLRQLVQRFKIGDFYSPVFVGWYNTAKGEDDLRLPERRETLRAHLRDRLGYEVSPYIFYDNGTFEKELPISVREGGRVVDQVIGSTSASTVVAIFTPRRGRKRSSDTATVLEVLEDFRLKKRDLMSIPSKRSVYAISGQTQLSL